MSINELNEKIQKLENEINDLKTKKRAKEKVKDELEALQNPEDVKKEQPHIDSLKGEIKSITEEDIPPKEEELKKLYQKRNSLEEKERQPIEKRLKAFSVREGDVLFHWAFGPVRVDKIDKYIYCSILETEGIEYVRSPKYIPGTEKLFSLDSLGKWLFKDSKDAINSIFFDSKLKHASYA